MVALHLSHTDIRADSRILKEMNALQETAKNDKVIGFGIEANDGSKLNNTVGSVVVNTYHLYSRYLKLLPKFARHILSLIEISIKYIIAASKVRPTIVHCHDTLTLPAGVIIKKIFNSKLIYDAHELESDRNGLSKTLGKMTLFMEKLLWPSIDALIVVSDAIENWYYTNISSKRSSVILNSPVYELSERNKKNRYFHEKFGISEGTKMFLYLGILGPGRGIDLIVEAFKDPSIDSHVVFMGFGDYKQKLEEIQESCPNIHVHDAVPHKEVVPISSAADVGFCLIQNVSLSDYLCLPNKLFEYAFAGIPVIGSDFPEIRRIVKAYNLGECCALDVNSIKKAILKFQSCKEPLVIRASNLEDLGWAVQAEKLCNLYRAVLE
jgi:glycosyltransferase involved in cell wall biosynthesis